jgi:hypothetical protein
LHSGSVIAVATVVLVIVTSVYVWLTGQMAVAADKEATATNRLAREMTEDRELSVRPVLVCIEASLGTTTRADGVSYKAPAVIIRNIGRGPAINVVIWGRYQGKSFAAYGITVATGEIHPSPNVSTVPATLSTRSLNYVANSAEDADPAGAVVGEADDANLFAYCGDQLGTRLRFNLRRSIEPPEVWRRGEPAPPWARAWSASGAEGA